MDLLSKQINILTIIFLVLQLCLPVYGPAYFSEVAGTAGASQAGVVCLHADVGTNHESQGRHPHVTPCHELDAPCDIHSAFVFDQRPIISSLTATDKGTLLPGYGAPFDIPPESLL